MTETFTVMQRHALACAQLTAAREELQESSDKVIGLKAQCTLFQEQVETQRNALTAMEEELAQLRVRLAEQTPEPETG